jgi:hypothetical protein
MCGQALCALLNRGEEPDAAAATTTTAAAAAAAAGVGAGSAAGPAPGPAAVGLDATEPTVRTWASRPGRYLSRPGPLSVFESNFDYHQFYHYKHQFCPRSSFGEHLLASSCCFDFDPASSPEWEGAGPGLDLGKARGPSYVSASARMGIPGVYRRLCACACVCVARDRARARVLACA